MADSVTHLMMIHVTKNGHFQTKFLSKIISFLIEFMFVTYVDNMFIVLIMLIMLVLSLLIMNLIH